MFFFRHPLLFLLSVAALAFNAFLWWAVLRYVPESEGRYTIQFSFIEGVTFVGSRSHFFVFPAAALGFLLLHITIAASALKRMPELSYLSLLLSFIMQALVGFVVLVLLQFNRIL